MEWVETTGRTVDEAKDAALDQLGVDETDAEFEVLEEPRGGLFGRLRSEARVRARVRPTKPPPKMDRRDRRRRRRAEEGPVDGDDGERVTAPADQGSGGGPPGPRGRAGRGGGGRGGRGGRGERGRREGGERGEPGRARRPAGEQRPAAPERGPREDERADSTGGSDMSDVQDAQEAGDAPDLEEQAGIVGDFVQGLVDAFDVDASVEHRAGDDEDGFVEVNVEGEQLGILIGPRGQTLEAIQELSRTVLQRHTVGAPSARVRIDVAGYRQRRREALARFAVQVAEEARSAGARKALEPMNAADRKVVHDAVNEVEGVSTTSEGEDPRRRVVIVPDADADADDAVDDDAVDDDS